MRDLGRVLAHIPARAGSKRVKAKNLRLIDGEPLLSYSIKSSLEAGIFDEVYVNSDSDEMLNLASSLGASCYRRSPELASDTASGDEFTYDFIKNKKPDTLVMISPVCPLISKAEIVAAVNQYASSGCDTLISCESTQMQTFCENKPININVNEQLAPSQENPVVQVLNWAVTIWDAEAFVINYEKSGYAYIGVERELFPIDPIKAVKISKESDFQLAESLLKSNRLSQATQVEYWNSKGGEK